MKSCDLKTTNRHTHRKRGEISSADLVALSNDSGTLGHGHTRTNMFSFVFQLTDSVCFFSCDSTRWSLRGIIKTSDKVHDLLNLYEEEDILQVVEMVI